MSEGCVESSGMALGHLEELAHIEGTYWWHVAKRSLVINLLKRYCPPPGDLLEGGVGAGGNLAAFRDMGYIVKGLDTLPPAVDYCCDRGLLDVYVHDLEKPWPFDRESADVVIMLDVLEHLRQPAVALTNAAASLRTGGRVVLTVPAMPSLFGPWDKMLGHHRRYTRELLGEHTRSAGLKPLWMSHWNAYSLPGAILVRSLQKVRSSRSPVEFPQVPAVLNSALIFSGKVERKLMRIVPLPIGLSLVGVFAK